MRLAHLALASLALAPLAPAWPAAAQPADPHAHHRPTPAAPAAKAPDPHAGHAAPAPSVPKAADPHAGHAPADPHAGHVIAPPPAIASTPPPPLPTDRDADRHFGRPAMEAAREVLRREHGDIRWTKAMVERAEVRPASGADGYAWDATASYGGDVGRFVLRSEGEGAGKLESAEFRALASRAISPWFNLQAGVRQDLEPRSRTYATVGVEGLAPYFFEVEGALFLSQKGDLTARLEGAFDLRLTQQLILEPRAEVNLAAQDAPELGLGSGLSSLEAGLRLRYELRPEIAPYIGAHYERSFGRTARWLEAAGEDRSDLRLVIGLRGWF